MRLSQGAVLQLIQAGMRRLVDIRVPTRVDAAASSRQLQRYRWVCVYCRERIGRVAMELCSERQLSRAVMYSSAPRYVG